MSTGIIVVIVVAVIVVAALVIGGRAVMRRRRLQQRFGPEYDRVVGESDSKHEAEGELAGRERRVRDLDIRALTDPVRASYLDQWARIQEQFVDAPADAVSGSQLLVASVMTERGYPTEHQDQILADLSVGHSGTLDRFRAAEEISQSAAAGTASTEDLRQAMIHYRALFAELLGDANDARPGPAAAKPGRIVPAADPAPKNGDAHADGTQHIMPGRDPLAAVDTGQQLNGSKPKERTK